MGCETAVLLALVCGEAAAASGSDEVSAAVGETSLPAGDEPVPPADAGGARV